MSYGGFEYNDSTGGGYGYGGFDVMSGGFGGGDMGGGFMGEAGATPKSADKKSNRDKQSLIPFTVKQLVSATQDPAGDLFLIDNSEVHLVRIMGIVEMVEEHATNVSYRVNDGTGVIECKLWVEKEKSRHRVCNQFSYVQVVGSLKAYEGRNHILVFNVVPVEDFNVMTHHFLEVILVHLQHTKGPIPGSKAVGSAIGQATSSPGQFGMHGQFTPGFPMTSGQSLQNSISSENESFHQKIVKALKACGTHDVGLTVPELQARVGGGYSIKAVSDAMEHLAGEGVVYTTVDEDHFKTTEE